MENNYNNLQEGKELEVMNAILDIKKAWQVLSQYSEDFVSIAMDQWGWYDMQDIAQDIKTMADLCTNRAEYRADRMDRGDEAKYEWER